MAQPTSPAILKALSAIVNDQLNYVSLVDYMDDSYYLVLGRFSFYFIKNDLSGCQAAIKYAHLMKCLTDEKKQYLLQLQLSDNRDVSHPQKLNIVSQDRTGLIESLMCYWQIDYMYRYTAFAKFPLLQRQQIDTKAIKELSKGTTKQRHKIPQKLMKPPLGFKTHEFKGYKFFLPKFYARKKGKESEYKHIESNDTLLLQVSDFQPVDDLCKMPDNRKDIQEFTQNFAQAACKGKYFIVSSKPYFKKKNLTNDKAQWLCWQVNLRTGEKDIFVTALRRKYIPPLMEIFQDIVWLSQFDLFDQNAQGELRDSKEFLETVHSEAVDSLYPIQKQPTPYKNIIEEKATALLMDEETMNYYTYNMGIQPEGIIYAVSYVKSIISIIARYLPEYKDLLKLLKSKMSKGSELIDKPPAQVIKSFEDSTTFSVKNNINWVGKIAAYMAYCVDGGLLCSQFTIASIIRALPNISESTDELILKNELVYLLNCRKIGQRFERSNQPLQQIIKDFRGSITGYVFNERVLIVLIEAGYIQQEYSFLNPQDYPDFLNDMLNKMDRIKLKEAACRQIIKIFAEKKKKEGTAGETAGGGGKKIDESSKIEFINLVEPLIKTMKKNNYNLAALAASALVNLFNYSEDIKDMFVQQQGLTAILEYLTCKEEETLLNILRLLLALIANSEPIGKLVSEENNNEAVHSLLSIIRGPDIPGTQFSLKITFFSLQILRALIQYSQNAKTLLIDDAKTIDTLVTLIRFDNLPNINDQMELSILSFLTQVCREEIDYKRIIGKRALPILSERLNNIIEFPLQGQIELKFFKMISVLTKSCKENIFTVKGMKEKLTNYMNHHTKDQRIKQKIQHIQVMAETYEE